MWILNYCQNNHQDMDMKVRYSNVYRHIQYNYLHLLHITYIVRDILKYNQNSTLTCWVNTIIKESIRTGTIWKLLKSITCTCSTFEAWSYTLRTFVITTRTQSLSIFKKAIRTITSRCINPILSANSAPSCTIITTLSSIGTIFTFIIAF